MRGFATITLDPRGGGVASASRLIWRVFQDAWPEDSWLMTLDSAGAARTAGVPARLGFGARLAIAQAFGSCDWVCYGHLSAALVQSYLPRPARRPYAVFLHGIEAWRALSPRQRRVLEGATLVLANSAYTARRVARAHPWIGPIAECGLALADEKPIAAGPSPPGPPGRDVLIVGRMSSEERYKGHDQLLDAWPAVIARVHDARLVIVGTGDDEPRLRQRARDLGLGSSVLFAGFVPPDALESAYRHAAVFAMPSREEGFGLVYLEAMAHRLPCVGSIHDAAGDVIDDGVTGFLVDQADASSLAARLVELLSDEGLRRRMGLAGERRLHDRFSYESFRDRLANLCEGAFGAGPGTVLDATTPGRASVSR